MAGLVLVLLLATAYRPIDTWIKQNAAPRSLVYYAAHYSLMALGLDWMGVLRARWRAAAYLAAALGVGAYFLLIALNYAGTAYTQMRGLYPEPQGGLLFGLCVVLGVKGALRRERITGEALVEALPLLGMVLLACLGHFITTTHAMMGIGTHAGGALNLLLKFSWLWCLFLIPFLGKDRWGGWALLIAGLSMAALLCALPMAGAARAGGALGWIDGMYGGHGVFFLMLGVGGLYCLIPRRESVV